MADDDIGIYDDLVGGEVATRFRYRMVEPNDFGLTDEEILLADDKELNKWCSLKKMSQYRTKEFEKFDKKVYTEKANNLALKKKIFKSLYDEEQDDEPRTDKTDDNIDSVPSTQVSKKKRKKKKSKKQASSSSLNNSSFIVEPISTANETNPSSETKQIPETTIEPVKKPEPIKVENNNTKSKKRKRHSKQSKLPPSVGNVDLQRLKAYGMSNREIKKMKNKL